jgi:hypothetical protein
MQLVKILELNGVRLHMNADSNSRNRLEIYQFCITN